MRKFEILSQKKKTSIYELSYYKNQMYNYRHYIYIVLCKDSKAVVYNGLCSVKINMTLTTGKNRKVEMVLTKDNR